ncbi:hypothetical protein BofuT4_P075310.1 [Botrytis cinerea T4]|uniref:Uncharacterized protein n=1 Tax=Botryotinia fuckeliana (strain T4) TaxID=999810 RepID=G2XNJ2_BOTF4|nr:hypothetical protein BofuT4_P075310.1 [Botrytis cinerea T4]
MYNECGDLTLSKYLSGDQLLFTTTIFCSRSTASTEGDLRRLARLCKGKDSRERKARERSSKVKQGKTRCWAQRLLDRKRFCFWTCPRFRANHQTREACT